MQNFLFFFLNRKPIRSTPLLVHLTQVLETLSLPFCFAYSLAPSL